MCLLRVRLISIINTRMLAKIVQHDNAHFPEEEIPILDNRALMAEDLVRLPGLYIDREPPLPAVVKEELL